VDNELYTNTLSNLLTSDYGLNISSGVNLNIGGDSTAYTVVAYHLSGNKTFTLNGPGGVIIE